MGRATERPPHRSFGNGRTGSGSLNARWVGQRLFAACVAVLSLAALAPGCGTPSFDAALLQIDSVGPAELREGSTLVVDGAGFEAGEQGELTLEGSFYAPGVAPRTVNATFSIRALSESRAAVRFGAAELESLGGRGTFEGRASLRFEAVASGTTLAGARPDVRLDVHPAMAALADRLDEEGAEAAERFGFQFEEGALDDGLLLSGVDGKAEQAGLQAGDRIVSLGHVRIRALSDLRPPPGDSDIVVRVQRPDVAEELERVLGTGAPPPAQWPWKALALLALLLLVVGGPARGLATWCWSLRAAWGRGVMLLQGFVTVAFAALMLLGEDVLQATTLVVAFLYLLVRPEPLRAAFHLAPALAALFYGQRFLTPGDSAPLSWAFVQRPEALVLLVVTLVAAASRAPRSGWKASRRAQAEAAMALGLRSVLIAAATATFATQSPVAWLALAFGFGVCTPPLRAHLGRTAALTAVLGALGGAAMAGFQLSPPAGLDGGVLPLALVLAFAVAWLGTGPKPFRAAVGL